MKKKKKKIFREAKAQICERNTASAFRLGCAFTGADSAKLRFSSRPVFSRKDLALQERSGVRLPVDEGQDPTVHPCCLCVTAHLDILIERKKLISNENKISVENVLLYSSMHCKRRKDWYLLNIYL